ncbi:MAG: hypothetical protein ACLUNZ_08475 [Evtepia sp.]
MVHSFLHKPESAQGVFEEHTLTIWTDSELTMSFLNRGDTPDRAGTMLLRLHRAKAPGEVPGRQAACPADAAQVKRITAAGGPTRGISLMICWALGRQFGNFKVK